MNANQIKWLSINSLLRNSKAKTVNINEEENKYLKVEKIQN